MARGAGPEGAARTLEPEHRIVSAGAEIEEARAKSLLKKEAELERTPDVSQRAFSEVPSMELEHESIRAVPTAVTVSRWRGETTLTNERTRKSFEFSVTLTDGKRHATSGDATVHGATAIQTLGMCAMRSFLIRLPTTILDQDLQAILTNVSVPNGSIFEFALWRPVCAWSPHAIHTSPSAYGVVDSNYLMAAAMAMVSYDRPEMGLVIPAAESE
ncbi:predicted protein [Coccidioides posadasii str. Silveira]|uniref:Predicted protein n=1 Tax=Coccidioides posadasii (strain RMSCC 757 / Silveira) TaxID=443226 RepID=E9CZT2_COCPS|nr:predicted protein [Coccidioides posadasii str. Silveira]